MMCVGMMLKVLADIHFRESYYDRDTMSVAASRGLEHQNFFSKIVRGEQGSGVSS